MTPPTCPYCGDLSKLVTGAKVYPHRPELHQKLFYQCIPCKAYVGCHEGTKKPLGRLANEELRKAKSKAHAAFDPLWKKAMRLRGWNKKEARGKAYKWLSSQMNIERSECHIGMFDVERCRKVVEICEERVKSNTRKRRSGQHTEAIQ